jgi:hypothetical protein
VTKINNLKIHNEVPAPLTLYIRSAASLVNAADNHGTESIFIYSHVTVPSDTQMRGMEQWGIPFSRLIQLRVT